MRTLIVSAQGHRVVTLIDGDGAIFASELIAQAWLVGT